MKTSTFLSRCVQNAKDFFFYLFAIMPGGRMTFKCNTRNIMERPAVVSKNGEKGWKKIIDFCSIFEIDIYNNFCFSINSVYIYTHTSVRICISQRCICYKHVGRWTFYKYAKKWIRLTADRKKKVQANPLCSSILL